MATPKKPQFTIYARFECNKHLLTVTVRANSLDDAIVAVQGRKSLGPTTILAGIEGLPPKPQEEFPHPNFFNARTDMKVDLDSPDEAVQYPLKEGKMFLAFWGSGAFENSGFQLVPQSTFREELCYDEDEIEQINRLSPGGVWHSRHYGPYHSVMRIA